MSIEKAIRESSLPNKDDLVKLIKPGIFIHAERIDSTEQQVGVSRIGGTPDLPIGIEWPYSGEHPHAFVAQINLAELTRFRGREILPDDGMLYFFFEPTQSFSTDVLSPGHSFFKVIYYPQPWSTLKSHALPEKLGPRWRFPPTRLTYSVNDTFPDLFWGGFGPSPYPALAELEEKVDEVNFLGEDNRHDGPQILGHAGGIQNYVELSCEGERVSLSYPDLNSEKRWLKIKSGLQDWELLLQIHSDWNLGIDWLYDWASVYFMIWRPDLIQRKFDRAWLVYQDH